MYIAGKLIEKIHCLGVGGVGVGPLAACLQQQGYIVSGSDRSENSMTARLRKLGVQIQIGHEQELPAVDVLFYSSAIKPDNPQWQAAKERGIIILQRAEMLAQLAALRDTIAISGTHGKTTTSALCAHMLTAAHNNPSYMVGGLVQNTQRYMQWADSQYFVVEADESDASFLHLKPKHAIVTNVEADHMETYGDMQTLQDAFLRFLMAVPADGVAVLNFDDPICVQLANKLNCRVLTFATGATNADYRVLSMHAEAWSMHFTIALPNGEQHDLVLSQPGAHNVMNALAALALLHDCGVSIADIKQSLASFKGVGRRLTYCGEHRFAQVRLPVINDYGHHPTELAAAISAVRDIYPNKRLLMVFQPHRYTRTRDCFAAFVEVLAQVDCLLLLDTYAASEQLIAGADSAALAAALAAKESLVHSVASAEEVLALCDTLVQENDVLLLQGAGNVGMLPGQWQQRLLTQTPQL